MMKKLVLILTILTSMATSAQKFPTLVVGTYTNKCESEGIYIYDFNTDTGEFSLKSHTDKVASPSYLTVSDDGNFIYSVNENGANSTISSFFFKFESGAIGFMGKVDSKGADPCYIIDDAYHVIAANYSGGSIAVFKKNKFGSLDEATQVIKKHSGSSINKERQEKPHVHFVQFTPDGKFLVANDLGTDKVYIYKYIPDAEEPLTLHTTVDVRKGSGPRHLVFSRDGKHAYLIHELDGTVTAFAYNEGMLRSVQETTIIETGFKGKIGAADIQISPDGKYLYATNRGDANDISCFAIAGDGRLSFVERVSTLGKGPRNFTIDPTGRFLLVAHQDTDNVVVFDRDPDTGKLTDTGKRLILCSPVCLKFVD